MKWLVPKATLKHACDDEVNTVKARTDSWLKKDHPEVVREGVEFI